MSFKDKKICLDITGFVKPYMIYFIKALKMMEFTNIDIIYSEPKYIRIEKRQSFLKRKLLILEV